MMQIKRNILLNPGPSTTTDTVKMAQVVPDICPREKEFAGLMKQMREDLVRIVHGPLDEYTAVLFCGSGTINIDICLNSLLDKDKKALIINNGAYSTRAAEVCEYYGLPHINLVLPVDDIPDLDLVERTLDDNPDIGLVYITHNETGTGIGNPIREIGKMAHEHGAIFVTDTTSTYAMVPIDVKRDNIDFCMASAQKGIMGMTGLSFIVGRKDIIEKSKDYPKRSYYCNLYMQYDFFERTGEMHFTPPVQTIYAARQALDEYFAEGEEAKWARHTRVMNAIHDGLERLGFREAIRREIQVGLVASVIYPDDENWDFEKVHDYCYERGFTIYPGKITGANTFRLCALGAIDVSDIEDFFVVLRQALEANNIAIPLKYNN
ncbi:MAG: 2-aminoethylphosphonate aminotransferase [Lachnospiraceae bacterium]|nr:2-aminoethylphosphonate aminotransferase [Lachnospiraceae bacterium]